MSVSYLALPTHYEHFDDWLSDFNDHKYSALPELTRIVELCPDKKADDYFYSLGIVQGRIAHEATHNARISSSPQQKMTGVVIHLAKK